MLNSDKISKIMKIKDLTSHLETIAPLDLQESYDNAGLITGNPEQEITGVITALDAVEEVIDEALAHNCNVVVTHHPIVFRGLKKITGRTYVERTIIKAIRHGIAIYAIHTNLDNVLQQGVNARIGQRLQLKDTSILAPRPEDEQTGSGLLGYLPEAMPEEQFLPYLKEHMQVNCIRHTRLLGKPVRKLAVCGGAGGFLLPQAIRQGAEVFITADYKYHEFFDADGQLIIADIGHYESEQFTIDLLYDIITQKFSTFAVRKTEIVTNPVRYFV